MVIHPPYLDIALQLIHEERTAGCNPVQYLEVHVCPVNDVECSWLNNEPVQEVGITWPGCGDIDKGWY